jgi:hypothetical protein
MHLLHRVTSHVLFVCYKMWRLTIESAFSTLWEHEVENAEPVKKLFILPKDSVLLTRLRVFP